PTAGRLTAPGGRRAASRPGSARRWLPAASGPPRRPRPGREGPGRRVGIASSSPARERAAEASGEPYPMHDRISGKRRPSPLRDGLFPAHTNTLTLNKSPAIRLEIERDAEEKLARIDDAVGQR